MISTEASVFDAYVFSSELIASAKNSIILLDNYIDEKTLLQLSKRDSYVSCVIYAEKINPQLKLDLVRQKSAHQVSAGGNVRGYQY